MPEPLLTQNSSSCCYQGRSDCGQAAGCSFGGSLSPSVVRAVPSAAELLAVQIEAIWGGGVGVGGCCGGLGFFFPKTTFSAAPSSVAEGKALLRGEESRQRVCFGKWQLAPLPLLTHTALVL